MTMRLDIFRALSLGLIALSLMAVGAMTVPRAVPLVMSWGEHTGAVALVIAVVGLLVVCGVFAVAYWFVASVLVAVVARLFTTPEVVSKLLLGAGWPAFDRVLGSALRRLGLAR
jgi:hypothetical protein